MSKTELWDSICVTDPTHVKKITGKPYQGSSPKPYWLIRKATEKFGPIGIGWGVTVKSERFERMTETIVLHVAVVSVWFVLDGVRSETFDQMGGTQACYTAGSGKVIVDEDAGKKSVTDGMVKCLSMIGFAGDIFAGQWDDSKYVEWAGQQFVKGDAPIASARGGIGDDLPDADKQFLTEGAYYIKTCAANNTFEEGKRWYKEQNLEADQETFMFNQLSSEIRTKLKEK